jgi:hypothetical protein
MSTAMMAQRDTTRPAYALLARHIAPESCQSPSGALWSTAATLAVIADPPQDLQTAVLPNGSGVVVDGGSFEDQPIDVYQVDPHRAKVARARFGSTTVQLRADDGDCIPDTQLGVRVQAARGGVLVGPGTVLRSARISVSRSRVEHRGRWSTLVDLRRSKAKRTACPATATRARCACPSAPAAAWPDRRRHAHRALRGGLPDSRWLSRHWTSLPVTVAQ